MVVKQVQRRKGKEEKQYNAPALRQERRESVSFICRNERVREKKLEGRNDAIPR